MVTTVFNLSDSHGQSCVLDVSKELGVFNPFLILYIRNIRSIDISGCRFLSPSNFMDCVVVCSNLQKIMMRSCTQFSEHQLARMLSKLKNLHYVDIDRCVELSFASAYWIVSSLQSLQMINFVPGNSRIELVDWKRLYNIFYAVSFGISFTRILPHYGAYVCGPEVEE